MCRFIAYLGKQPIVMHEILDKPSNSLIQQSRLAKETETGLNADGFGIGWYDFSIDKTPGLFKSIQPAWNNNNLQHLAKKLRSNCFIGHVRACTVGDITTLNCHPFSYQNYLFAHNGTIDHFDLFKRALLNELSDPYFALIKGQSDSEHFFALVMHYFYQTKRKHFLSDLSGALQKAAQKLASIRESLAIKSCIKLNVIITDGYELLAMRYRYPLEKEPLSMYYASASYVKYENNVLMQRVEELEDSAIVIASEPLTGISKNWHKIPENHILKVDRHYRSTFLDMAIEL